MPADAIRGRFTDISTDIVVMPAIAALSILAATHRLTGHLAAHTLFVASLATESFVRWCAFGIVSHFAFSLSMLHRCRARSRSMLVLSLLRSCALMTYILAFYLVRCHLAISYFGALGTFFSLAFVYQALRYNIHFARLAKHPETVLILGNGREAQKIWKQIRIQCDRLVSFKGFVCDATSTDAAPDILARTIGTIDSLEFYLQHTPVDTLVLAAAVPNDHAFAEAAQRIAKACGARLLCAREPERQPTLMRWLRIAGDSYIELGRPTASARASYALKAVADRVVAGAAVVLLLPVALPLLILYQLILGETALVSQPASGYRRRLFKMWDLRIASGKQRASSAQARLLARVGYFLTISGLARAPRLWNILRGEMSLVGPRPVLRPQISLGDSAGLLRRYIMRPGLCWPKPEMTQTEDQATLGYLQHWSLALDWNTFTHWFRSRVRRTLLAISTPLLPDHAALPEPTRRTL